VVVVVFFVGFATGRLIIDAIFEPTQSNYTEASYSGFMQGCQSQGATTTACQCLYDYLDRNTTDTEFKKLDQAMLQNPDYYPPIAIKAVDYCTGQ
jgi:hypothetical protein